MSIKKLLKIGLVGIVLASPIKDIRAQDTPPPLPSEHWGQVNYNGASSVPDGYSAVIKDSNNVVLGEMESGTIDGWYDVIAATDNPSTTQDEGAVDGEKTFVFINNYKAIPSLIHKPGPPINPPNDQVDLEVIIDTIPPEISITYPENDSLYTSHITELKYTLFDENPDSSWYSTDGGLTRIVVPWSSDTTITDLMSKQGENIWIVYAKDIGGKASSDSVTFNVDTTTTNIEDVVLPSAYSLSQNFPNPFNSSTIIEYSLPIEEHVSLKVYDILGRPLETLVNQEQSPRSYQVPFDGSKYSSGVYFYNLRTDSFNKTRKMILIK